MKWLLSCGLAALAIVTLPERSPAQAGDAYRIFGNSIRVDRSSHWESWVYQNDLVTALNVPISAADIFQVFLRMIQFLQKT